MKAYPYICMYNRDIYLDMFRQGYVLNLFSDTSTRRIPHKREGLVSACYGSIAVTGDNIIDSVFRLQSISTSNACEIRGIRCSLSLANKYKNNFKVINIFSDSKVAVFSLREYIHKWKLINNEFYSNGNRVVNQELYIECYQLIQELSKTHIVNIFHQKGHIKQSNYNSLLLASDVFKKNNGILGEVDMNLIRYISLYNNYIDHTTRSTVNTTDLRHNIYQDALHFYTNDYL